MTGLSLISLTFTINAQTVTTPQESAQARFGYADVQRLHSAQDVRISPDGQQVAYVLNTVDAQKDSSASSVWLLRVADKQTVNVASAPSGAPAFSPDGRYLAFVKGNNVTILEVGGRHQARSFAVPSSPSALVWSPNGEWLAFTLFVPDSGEPSFLQKAVDAAETDLSKPSDAQWASPVKVTEAARYHVDGGGDTTPGFRHLFVLSADSGHYRQIGAEPFDDGEPSWTPDSASLLFTSDRRQESAHSAYQRAIYQVELATGTVKQLTSGLADFASPSVSPDGKWIAFVKYEELPVDYTPFDLYVMRSDGTGGRQLGARLDRAISYPRWATDGRGIYASFVDHGITKAAVFELDGNVREVAAGIDGDYSVSLKGDVAYAGNSPSHPSEVMLQRPGAEPAPLTSLNDFLRQRGLAQLLHLQTDSSADGVPVEGWALLPPGSTTGAKLPAVLCIHGGPFGSDGPDWSSEFQLFAAAGYAVVYANYRGSTSYGRHFSEPANYDFPGRAYDDLMSIMDEAVRRGIADPHRLFVTGGSAGGELTAWIVGKTDRFRAAVAVKPVINQMSEALISDQYIGDLQFTETAPWLNEKDLWSHSPLSLVGNVKTPTMLIVGEDDIRTPPTETLQFYDALQLRTVPTALMRVPGASHESLATRPSQFAAEVAATIAWFRRYDSLVPR